MITEWNILALLVLTFLVWSAASTAMCLNNLIHCALALVLSFVGIGGLYLWLGAEFVGFVQILVYVGAVSILVIFTVLLTRRGFESEDDFEHPLLTLILGPLLVVPLFWLMGISLLRVDIITVMTAKSAAVLDIGLALGREYLLPLLAVGVLLTAALIGAACLASESKKPADAEGK